jgi:hypothetical protein
MRSAFRPVRTTVCTLSALLAPLLLAPASLVAQGTLREQSANLPGGAPRQIIAINPFMPLAGYFQGEYERTVRDNASVAVGASYVPWNRDVLNADIKLRLYLQDRALEGLGLAAGVGLGRTKQADTFGACAPINCVPPEVEGAFVTAPTFSMEAQYQWLLGRTRATAVTVGGGIKRYFFSEADVRDRDVSRVLPTGRLTIGWAFK